MVKLKMGLDKSPKTCYNKDKIKERKCLNMRKAILNENRKVIRLEKFEEPMSQKYQDHVKHTKEVVSQKYKFRVDK